MLTENRSCVPWQPSWIQWNARVRDRRRPEQGNESYHDVKIASELVGNAAWELRELLREYKAIFLDVPGLTKLEEHAITLNTVERGSSVVECRTRNQVSPGSNPSLLPFRRLGIFVLSIDAPVHSAV